MFNVQEAILQSSLIAMSQSYDSKKTLLNVSSGNNVTINIPIYWEHVLKCNTPKVNFPKSWSILQI